MAQLKDTEINGTLSVTGKITGNITGEAAATESKLTAEVARAQAAEKVNADNLTAHKNNKSNPHGVTKAQVGLSNVSNKTDSQLKQMTFDIMFPVGKVLQQLPGEESPQTMYNKNGVASTWQDITSSYNGRFFKIDSTKNVGTTTAESLPNIRGAFATGDFSSSFNGPSTFYTNDDFSSSDPRHGIHSGAFLATDNRDIIEKISEKFSFGYLNGSSISKLGATILQFSARDSLNVDNWGNPIMNDNGIPSSIDNPAYKDPVNGVPVKVQPDNVSIKLWKRTK